MKKTILAILLTLPSIAFAGNYYGEPYAGGQTNNNGSTYNGGYYGSGSSNYPTGTNNTGRYGGTKEYPTPRASTSSSCRANPCDPSLSVSAYGACVKTEC